MLDAVVAGAKSLERYPTWDQALAWWAMLAQAAGDTHGSYAAYAARMQGNIQVHRGNLAQAAKAYQTYRTLAERLAGSDPGNAGWQRDLSISHDRIGDVLVAQGDRAGALDAYRADMQIAERLAGSDPGNADWQRDLFVSLFKLTKVLLQNDDRTQACVTALRLSAQADLMAARFPQDPERDRYYGWAKDLHTQACGAPP